MLKFIAGFLACYLIAAALIAYQTNQIRHEPLEASVKHGLAWGIREVLAVVAPEKVGDWYFTK